MSTKPTCFHCGQAVADVTRWTVLVNQRNEPMCCPACQAVASAILAGGLENYYRYRSQLASKPETRSASLSSWELYDDEKWQQQFVLPRIINKEAWNEVHLTISNMHCAACCWLIERALEGFPAAHININLATHQAVLRWQPAQHRLSELLQRIADVGYKAVPSHSEQARDDIAKEQKHQLLRLGVAGLAMMQAMMFALAIYSGDWSGMEHDQRQLMNGFSLLLILPVMFYSALPFYRGAIRSLRARQPGMDVPVSLALWIAFIASGASVWRGQGDVYFDSISMFAFLLLLARYAEARVRNHYFSSSAIALPVICQCLGDASNPGSMVSKPVVELAIGDVILVRNGETIPVDAVIVDGNSSVNEASFSGESLPVKKQTGDPVYAGTINGDGILKVRVTNSPSQTKLDQLTRLADTSLAQKPAMTLLADKLASVFTLFVLMLAVVSGCFWYLHEPLRTLSVVLSILVVSCPCALSLATPAALAFCYQALRQRGVLAIKTNATDHLAAIDTVIFDKTGTLTDGQFSLLATVPLTTDSVIEKLTETAAALESHSGHPLALAFNSIATDLQVDEVKIEIAKGVEGKIAGNLYRVGSLQYCAELAGNLPQANERSVTGNDKHMQRVYLATRGKWLACFELADQVRPEAGELIRSLQRRGLRVEILSGDHSGSAQLLASLLGISNCFAGISPEQKLEHVRRLQQQGHKVLMIGDGINDIPVLAQADASMAMPLASDLAKIKADLVLLEPNLTLIGDAIDHSAKARMIVRENIAWALLYNGVALPLAAAGLIQPWLAALGMSLSSLLVTFNSLRLRKL